MYIDFRRRQKERERSIDRLLPIHAPRPNLQPFNVQDHTATHSPDQSTVLVLPKIEDIGHPLGTRTARPAPTLLLLVPLSPASLHDVMKEEIIKFEDKNYHL